MKKKFRYRSSKSIHLTIEFSEINGVALSGSGNVQSEDLIKANEFGIALSGSGELNLNISAQHVKSAISGSGNISLENNGGFSSVRHSFRKKVVSEFEQIVLKVKGDGKTYQFRIKEKLKKIKHKLKFVK